MQYVFTNEKDEITAIAFTGKFLSEERKRKAFIVKEKLNPEPKQEEGYVFEPMLNETKDDIVWIKVELPPEEEENVVETE